jgi:hypothetical protein
MQELELIVLMNGGIWPPAVQVGVKQPVFDIIRKPGPDVTADITVINLHARQETGKLAGNLLNGQG